MCGLFGVFNPNPMPQREEASRIAALGFEALGYLAQERGSHASGFAFFRGRLTAHPATLPPCGALDYHRLKLDGWWIHKATRNFYQFWTVPSSTETALLHSLADSQPATASHLQIPTSAPLSSVLQTRSGQERYREAARRAKLLMGHTRYATRGDKNSLANTSPLLVGNLIGTHNGGVAITKLTQHYQLPTPHGETSSEIIFSSLDRVFELHAVSRPGSAQIVEVLQYLSGRAALAWIDRNQPLTLYLARTALSPLAIGWDHYGNFYWASNPAWFSQLDEISNNLFQFERVSPVEEGTLLVVGRVRPDKIRSNPVDKYSLLSWSVQILEERHFQPYVRSEESDSSNAIWWRGLTPEQVAWEQSHIRHKIRTDQRD